MRRDISIHIASLSLIARGKKKIISVIAITSKPGNRDPKVPNAKTRDRVPVDPDQSHQIPGFNSPPAEIMIATPLEWEPSDWLKGYAVITVFRTCNIVIHIAHEYGVTIQVNPFF